MIYLKAHKLTLTFFFADDTSLFSVVRNIDESESKLDNNLIWIQD